MISGYRRRLYEDDTAVKSVSAQVETRQRPLSDLCCSVSGKRWSFDCGAVELDTLLLVHDL